MESLPLIAKSNAIGNLDVTSLIREIFQTELGSYVPSKKLSENLRKSLVRERYRNEIDGEEGCPSSSFENLPNEKRKLIGYAENVFEAYVKHEEALEEISKVEMNVMEAQAMYLKREKLIQENYFLRDLLRLKRHPLLKSYNAKYVKEYKLLQGESGLPPKHEADLDFRMKHFKKWKKRLSNPSKDTLMLLNVSKTGFTKLATDKPIRKERISRPKKAKIQEEKQILEVFRADTTAIYFIGYTVGNVYQCQVTVVNIHTKPMKFTLKPMPLYSPFKVEICGMKSTRVLPGFSFKLLISFMPKNLDDQHELIVLAIEDGTELVIPVVSYLEPPLLKTHEDLDEQTKKMSEKILNSYIDCGQCFPGDSKVIKIRFHSFGGTGEFFLMDEDNWNNWHIENVTPDNFTEIPSFRFYPTYFRMEKNQFIDLFVEFKPQTSGLHSENIVIACSNGEIRTLDILGDGIAYNSFFFAFEESLEKNFSAAINDDFRATYYLDLGSSLSTGTKEKAFTVFNKSIMPFEFRWEMRDAAIPFGGQAEPGKLSHLEIKVEPSSGVFQPNSRRTFQASVFIENKPIGQYRTVLSLYVVGLPYESIEQASTIIRPSVLRGRFKSGSVFGEEDNLSVSPEYSYQGTFESIQEGMKTSSEMKCQQQFPSLVCRKYPSICALPLKRSKTLSHTGVIEGCACSAAAPVSVSPESPKGCDSSYMYRKPNITDLGSDLLWDFVDVLVDEIEVWLEVVPPDIRIEPCIVHLFDNVRVNEEPLQYLVTVQNYSDFPITCNWMKHFDKAKSGFDAKVNTLYQSKSQPDAELEMAGEDEDIRGDISENEILYSSNYCVKCYTSQRWSFDWDAIEDASANRYVELHIKPKGPFTVSPQSGVECTLSVSAHKSGIINREINLFVENADSEVTLYVIGKVPDCELTVSPSVLDFACRRSGARFTKLFKIKSSSGERVEWKAEQYSFDYEKGVLTGPIDENMQSNLTRMRGVVEGERPTIEKYTLNAKKPGMQATLVKLDLANPSYARSHSAYLLVLADVQTPRLAIEAPRFKNAILSPSQTMYVGKVITQNIVLKNTVNVTTTFIWGYPFGCHKKNLHIEMSRKCGTIGSLKKVVVEIKITPLEEGIVEHFYVPCFFSRKASPVILSVVGVVKNVQVMFWIGSTDLQCGGITSDLKIPWPIKNFDPVIGLSHLSESTIFAFECHCDLVDEEYEKSMNKKIDEVIPNPEKEEEETGPYEVEYDTTEMMMELGSGIRQRNGLPGEIDYIIEEPEVEREYEKKEEEGIKSESVSAIMEFPNRECIDILYYAASELQFLKVMHKTVAVKHFVIKNDSPLNTAFSLHVKYFGKVEHHGCKDKILEIKKRVFGKEKGHFEDCLIYGQPLVITTSPSEGLLEGFSSVRVSVFVYGNTWGEYRDVIICNIAGTPPFLMKVLVQLSGHPIAFPMFKPTTMDVPVLRFNPIKFGCPPIVRTIRVKNTSSIPVTVTWMVFLTSPLPEDSKEEPFSLCLDMYTDKESDDPEKATKSSQNYLSKNTSGSIPFFDMTDMEKSSSQCTGMEPMSEVDSGKITNSVLTHCCTSEVTPPLIDSTKPEVQLLENFGKIDLSVFQVYPRELNLEPYTEEKITVTFDHSQQRQIVRKQDFEAIVTGCVRLRQEYTHYPEIYYRPCGKDYVSKLLVLSACVERPLLQFEFCMSDLQYIVNANDILKSKNQKWKMKKKYIIKNRNETPITVFVRNQPGEFFTVKRIETNSKIYSKFNPDYHPVTAEPRSSIEVHVEAVVVLNQIINMWRKLNKKVQKEVEGQIRARESDLVGEGCIGSENSFEYYEEKAFDYDDSLVESFRSYTDSNFKITPHDSFEMIQRRALTWRNMTAGEETTIRSFGADEFVGESDECLLPDKPFREEPKHCHQCLVMKENIFFDQVGLAKQMIILELRVFFPSLKLSPELIDFGNVYIGETARRYSSIINLTQFPTEFIVVSMEESDFFATPKTGHLLATSNKSDIGEELMVKFSPKEPGYFKTIFKVFANQEMMFGYELLTVLGFGTWDEKFKYPKDDF